MPITREGWPFILPAAILTCGAWAIHWTWMGLALLVLLGFFVNFFRDPNRRAPDDPKLVLSPGDGHVVRILDNPEGGPLTPPSRQISIFLSVFDVHVNRAPIAGRIVDVSYNPGAFLPAFNEKASLRNEQNRITLEDGPLRVVFTQIAGLIARRIVFRKKVGDWVERGQRVGMIRFGSRVDLFLPADIKILVKVGDAVKGGLTPIGVRP